MNDLQVFKFNDNQVRTIVTNNEPWFVLKDVCEVLGINNHRMTSDRLDADEVSQTDVVDSKGRRQKTNVVNESGLYSVILRSDKPEAKTFRKWITSEVLPSIRKHGAYLTPDALKKSIADPQYVIGLLTELNNTQNQVNVQNQLIGELKPKADYLDLIFKGKSLMTITQIAKDYGWTGEEMNKALKELGIQYFQSGQWLLRSEHCGNRYTSSVFVPITMSDGRVEMKLHTKWTQKGRMFIYTKLKENGILPEIERED